MNRHFRGHTKPRTLFTQPQQTQQPEEHEQNHKHYMMNTNQNETPEINFYSDSITLTSENYKPNKALIDITGFDSLSPFVSTDKSHTLNNSHDNTYNDYNEGGPNNINDSDYRRRLIKQMQQSVFQQSESMFGNTEKTSQQRRDPSKEYDVSNTYTPSNAQSVYLQHQTKNLFKNIDN